MSLLSRCKSALNFRDRRRILASASRPLFEPLEERTLMSFTAPVSYTTGTTPHGITVADFNHDGRADMAVVNDNAFGTVSVLFGNGDGTFQPKSDYAAGSYSYDVTAADFNNDGLPDIAVANSASSATILMNNGDGTFSSGANIPTAVSAHSVVAADFNNDGKMDVAVATTSYVSLALGNGDGTFAATTSSYVGSSSTGIVTGDYNGDGNTDVAVPNMISTGTIGILLGNGDGSFQPEANYSAFSAPTAIAQGDFNHDGYDDLVVPNSYTSSAITVVLGHGDGSFDPPQTYQVPSAPFDVEVGDFNHDGFDDISEKSSNGFEVQLGKGDGTFYPTANYLGTTGPTGAVAVADFNNDGADDLISATNFGSVSVMMNANNDQVALSTAVGFTMSAPATMTANAAFPVTVTAVDASGNPVTDFQGTVYFTTADLNGKTLVSSYTFTALDGGVHTFPKAFVLSTLGSQTITASAPFMADAVSTVNVTPAITRLSVSAPAFTNAGDSFSFTVSALDALGNIGSNYTGTIVLNTNDLQSSIPASYTFTADDAGQHTFTGSLKSAGLRFIGAWDTVNPINGLSYINVIPGAPSSLTVVGGAGPVGLARPVTVAAMDAYGNLATGYNGTVHFSSSDPLAILPADRALTSGSGVFSVTLLSVGTQTITATDTNDPTLSGTDLGIQSAPAAAASFTVTGLSATTAGNAQGFTVTVKNTLGQIATDYTGTVYFSSTDVQAGLPAIYTFTAADAGSHTFAATLKTAGTQTVFATALGNAALTGSQGGVTVAPAAAATYALSGPVASMAGVAVPLTVTVRDAFGNRVSNYTGTTHLSSSDAQASLPADYTFTAADAGQHTFSVTLKTAALQSITAVDANNAAITATLPSFDVSPAAASTFALNPPSSIGVGTAFTLKVTVTDAFGNRVKDYAGTVHFSDTAQLLGLPADYTFSVLDSGVASFNVTLTTSGTQTLSINDVANTNIKGSLTVNVGSKSSGGTTTSTGGGGGGGGTTSTGGGGTSTGGGGGGGGSGKKVA